MVDSSTVPNPPDLAVTDSFRRIVQRFDIFFAADYVTSSFDTETPILQPPFAMEGHPVLQGIRQVYAPGAVPGSLHVTGFGAQVSLSGGGGTETLGPTSAAGFGTWQGCIAGRTPDGHLVARGRVSPSDSGRPFMRMTEQTCHKLRKLLLQVSWGSPRQVTSTARTPGPGTYAPNPSIAWRHAGSSSTSSPFLSTR